MFKGTFTALITPFKDGEIDFQAFERFVEWQIESGIHGLVPCGSTGESLLLSHSEQKALLQRCVSITAGRVPIIAGAGAITPQETLFLMEQAKEAGAQAALVVTPAYVKPGQEALYQHYKTLNDEGDFPLIIYNNPGRTGVTLDQETLYRLGTLPNIVGIKDSTNDLTRPTLTRLALGDSFLQFSGEDPTAVAFLSQGGSGWISVVANVAPNLCSNLYRAWTDEDQKKLSHLRDTVMPLIKTLGMDSNPVSIKCAVSLLGFCQNEVRRPLMKATTETEAALKEALTKI